MMMKQEDDGAVKCHSHLQNRLQLLQFGFLLLDFTVVVLTQFSQQQTGDIQHFLLTQELTPLLRFELANLLL